MNHDLTNGPIIRTMLRFALPMILGDLLQQCYNIADTLIVGRVLGADALAAVGSAFSLMTFLTSILLGLAMGSGTVFSIRFGQKKTDALKECVLASFVLLGSVTLILNVLVYLGIDWIIQILQIPQSLVKMMHDYLIVIFAGLAAIFLYNFFAALLRSLGNSIIPLVFLAVSAVLNIVLDPVFIFGLGMGTGGAGTATALSQSISFCILLSMFLRGKTVSQFRLSAVTREARDFGRILLGGAPSFGRQGLNSIGGMLLNLAARSYGDAAVAGMSIVSRIFMFIISVAIGVGQGLQPVASFNYGARKYRRVRQAAIFTIEAAFCMLVVLVGLCWVNGDALIRLFRDDPAVTAVALPAFHYQCLAMLLHPIIVVANMTFQSVGASGRATFLACCRQGVFFIPLILILPRTHGLFGVEICQPIADVLTFLVSLPFLLAFLQQLGRMDDAEQSKTAS